MYVCIVGCWFNLLMVGDGDCRAVEEDVIWWIVVGFEKNGGIVVGFERKMGVNKVDN